MEEGEEDEEKDEQNMDEQQDEKELLFVAKGSGRVAGSWRLSSYIS